MKNIKHYDSFNSNVNESFWASLFGAILILTSDQAVYGKAMQEGIEIAIEDCNAKLKSHTFFKYGFLIMSSLFIIIGSPNFVRLNFIPGAEFYVYIFVTFLIYFYV